MGVTGLQEKMWEAAHAVVGAQGGKDDKKPSIFI